MMIHNSLSPITEFCERLDSRVVAAALPPAGSELELGVMPRVSKCTMSQETCSMTEKSDKVITIHVAHHGIL